MCREQVSRQPAKISKPRGQLKHDTSLSWLPAPVSLRRGFRDRQMRDMVCKGIWNLVKGNPLLEGVASWG